MDGEPPTFERSGKRSDEGVRHKFAGSEFGRASARRKGAGQGWPATQICQEQIWTAEGRPRSTKCGGVAPRGGCDTNSPGANLVALQRARRAQARDGLRQNVARHHAILIAVLAPSSLRVSSITDYFALPFYEPRVLPAKCPARILDSLRPVGNRA